MAAAACRFLLLFTPLIFFSHLPFLRLPYYWDEVGQFVPASLDLLRDGALIPHSTIPNIHPPGVMVYLALAWRLFGFNPAVTRCAMLALASLGLLAAFLLAVELFPGRGGAWTLLAAVLLGVSPLFFAQAMLAQLDPAAMLLSTLALLLFLRERIVLSAAVCLVLVMVKETGLVVPLVLGLWLGYERRWREGLPYLASLIALLLWMAALRLHTGNWMGNPEFVRYNLYYPLHPVRLLLSFLRRLYYLFFADFRWIGTAALVYVWHKKGEFRSRSWKIAWVVVAAHVILFTMLGGAVLDRYLLPAMPVVYAAMAAAFRALPPRPRVFAPAVLLLGMAAGNFVNPLYRFPLEENLAFTDFVKVHAEAAAWLESRYPGTKIATAWPLTAELSHPEFGFVHRPLSVAMAPAAAPVLVAFGPGRPPVPPSAPFSLAAHFERHGQWVDVYVEERLLRSP
jgi:hypothetical protein